MPIVKGSGKRNFPGKDLATEKLWLVGHLAAGVGGGQARHGKRPATRKGIFPGQHVCISPVVQHSLIYVLCALNSCHIQPPPPTAPPTLVHGFLQADLFASLFVSGLTPFCYLIAAAALRCL